MKRTFTIILSLFFLLALLWNEKICSTDDSIPERGSNLMEDLQIVEYWNSIINDRLPVTYNHLLQGGYFNMPSARMGKEGEIGVGGAWVPPYHLYNLRMQLIDRLEVSGSYRVFKGIPDPLFAKLGFGDLSDKGANFKIALFHAEESNYILPGLSIGMEDFLGTRSFRSEYVVLTQVLINYDMEISLGYGRHRINGVFGGLEWQPFRKSPNSYIKGLSFAVEYDATPYKNPLIEPHPDGRVKKSHFNLGLKYRLWDQFDLTASYIRGDKFAFSASTYYNFGTTKGFIPKIEDVLPYIAPVNTQPLGILRPEDVLIQDLNYAMREQGFGLLEARMSYNECQEKILILKICNERYDTENQVRERLNYLLAYLIPSNIERVNVIIEAPGLPVQEYHYRTEFLRAWGDSQMGNHELRILTPLSEVTFPNKYTSALLFKKDLDCWNFLLFPKTHTFFGSATGKFKYSLGVNVGLEGFFSKDIFYSLVFGYNAISRLEDMHDTDMLNPSQLINVHTDIINYFKQKGITVDEAYLQKNWNMGRGWYSRLSLGYFDVAYGGFAGEFLYYPVGANWAFGVEGAVVKKRELNSMGFSNKIRKLNGFTPSWQKFTGTQYLFNAYYDWKETKLDFRFSAGKFLANDHGLRYEMSRYFDSGLRITFWYTRTNGHDKINGQTYYDKGIAFSMPLDIFYTYTCRERWNYGMSAWLRDVGFSTMTGQELYYKIDDEREQE
jgi:Exopolysaccharide biosynthesis protein YbjH